MSKRGAGKFFGVAAVLAAGAVFVKYLKDYTDFREAAEPDLSNLKDSSSQARDAVKRTYISIKDRSGVKEAAGDLAKAAGRMAKDAGSVAMIAGKTTVDTVKDIKSMYDEDPEAAKQEVLGNFKDMKDDIADTISEAADKISGIWKGEDDDAEYEAAEVCEDETGDDAPWSDGDCCDSCEETSKDASDEADEDEPKPEAATVSEDQI